MAHSQPPALVQSFDISSAQATSNNHDGAQNAADLNRTTVMGMLIQNSNTLNDLNSLTDGISGLGVKRPNLIGNSESQNHSDKEN